MSRHGFLIAVVLTIIFGVAPAYADITEMAGQREAFPLGEHYRIGKFFPIRLASMGGDARRLKATNALTVRPPTTGWTNAIVPLLAIGTIEHDGWSLRPLADNERLIGSTTSDETFAAKIFPDKHIVNVPLNLSDPLPGPAIAWGALDAVLLDSAAAARVTEAQVATLVASGTTVAVRASERPGGHGPWRREDGWWVQRLETPPIDGVIQPERYTVAIHDSPGWPARARRTAFFGLAAFSIVVIGLSLWKSRTAWIVIVVMSVCASGAIALWWSHEPTTLQTATVQSQPDAEDRWTSYAAIADGTFRHPIDAADGSTTWPILWSKLHASEIGLELECNSNGSPVAFVGHLKREQRIAFLSRTVTPDRAPATAAASPPR